MKKYITTASLFLIFIVPINFWARDVSPFNTGWEFKKAESFPDMMDVEWQKVTIPHTWNANDMQLNRNSYYEGIGYYKKQYTPAANLKDKRIYLRFEGVGAICEVYVNGKFTGNHKGAYSAFTVEISSLLKYGEKNDILIKVDNKSRPYVVPVNHRLFGVYGGIYRPVSLIVAEKLSIAINDYASSGVYISQENVSSKSASVLVKTKIDNKETDMKNIILETIIYEADESIKAKEETAIAVPPQGRQFITQNISIKSPHLWQGLEDPYLYKTVVRLKEGNKIVDEVVQPLGLRHFELKASDGMYLNGKKVPMYGVCRHQDWLGLGSALTNKEHDIDLSIIKEIGATTIRLAHYQQSDYIYSKCDSIGFMVWAEIPFVNHVTTEEGDNAKQQMTELIRQSYNHPSIYIWGLHNEVYNPAEYTNCLTTTLNDLAKSEDPYRYTASVSGYNQVDRITNLNADVQGINHYFGWYSYKVSDIKLWADKMQEQFPEYKIMFSEYGAEANINQQQETVTEVGDCCGFDKNYNETFATRFHEIQWGVISKTPVLIASYIWNTFDFATPMSSQGGVNSRNMKGLVTFDRKVKKDPFYWYKANWSKEPVLYITQRRVVNRGNEYTPVTVYSNIDIPRLFVNGQEVTEYSKGTTDVHYIFDNVHLKQGKNLVEVKVKHNGKDYIDKVEWNYSPEFKKNDEQSGPETNNVEHIGL